MATRTVGLKMELEGEKEYKEKIAEINRENKTLGEQMKKLAAEYRGNEDSIDALEKKQELLNRSLLEHQAKVAETQKQLESWREAQKRVKEEFGAGSEQYKTAQKKVQEYEAALAKAETAEIETKNAIEDTTEALENSKKPIEEVGEALEELEPATGKLGDQVKGLSSKLGINLPEGATKALNSINGFSAGAVAKMGAVAAAAAAAVKALKALYDTTIEAAARADDLLTKSVITGVSTQTLQQWQYAADFIDVSVDTMTGSMTKLTNSAFDAVNGNEKLAASFASLGVSVTDSSGQLRPAEEIFYDVVDALGKVQNQTERDAIAMDIMGRSAKELNPLIAQGSEALRGFSKDAEDAGYVLDEYQIAKLGEVDDAYHQMQLQIEATKNQLAVAFAPVAEASLKVVTAAVGVLTNALAKMNEMAEKAARAFKSLLGQQSEMKNYGGLGSDVYGATWKDDVQAYVTMGGTVITPDIIDQIDKTTGKPKNNFYLGEILPGESAYSYGYMSEADIQKLLAGRNAAGDANWRGGLTWVGESGPELVALPRGSRIWSNQESQQMGAAGTDTSRIEALLERNVQLLEAIGGEFSGLRVRRRMA